jgi:hypothetical protein
VGRDIAIEPADGRVYWCRTNGEIGWLDSDGTRGLLPVRLQSDSGPTSWRRIVWHPTRRTFIGLTARGGMLFSFDPAEGRIERIATLAGLHVRRPYEREPPATLAFELDASREEIRYLALGPALARRRTRYTVEAITVSLRDGSISRHGALRLDDGRHVTFAQGLSTRGDRWHALAWIELPAGSVDERLRKLRNWHGARARQEIHRLPEEVGLIAFDVTGARPA